MRAFACEADLTSASVCERSLGCRYIFRWPTGQGAGAGQSCLRPLGRAKGAVVELPERWVPAATIEAASVAGVLREGPVASVWFAHFITPGPSRTWMSRPTARLRAFWNM